MFALVDCNNFYASCERLFRPDLHNRPIIVLSSNDGCVIARSNEAKALGVGMGVPYFKVKGLCNHHKIHVFSSNFTLYGDLSNRVMSVIQRSWSAVEIYSIDEAFLDLSGMDSSKQTPVCKSLQKLILKETGIPTSIGIGKTKTLAKLANYVAKRQLNIPVVDLSFLPTILDNIPVDEVWGIGKRLSAKLSVVGIRTAGDLSRADLSLLGKRFSVMVQRTAYELRGISCLSLEEVTPNQSILSSKSFENLQSELQVLAESVSFHIKRAWEKLREQDLTVSSISVFIKSNRHRQDLTQYANSATHTFMSPTDDLCLLTHMAKQCLSKIYKPGIFYKKAGVLFEGLSLKSHQQRGLFDACDEASQQKSERLMKAIEMVNQRFGKHSMQLAAQGTSMLWQSKASLKSPSYTTKWKDIPEVKA